MARYRIVLDFETDDEITLGMLTRGLEYNDVTIRNAMFSDLPGVVGDCALHYKVVEAKETSVGRDAEELLDRKVDFSLFSVRAVNCMKAADVATVRDLVRHRKEDFTRFRNFGNKTFEELDRFLACHSLHWGMDV